ncbi:hypothetical protein PRZ48_007826 [Zasmidium cellare]|uniref:Uncharacterized protein n=1 Tax=Zasmidium cellare TaxID=395010 RepID=A0ABR0EL86_ZASCE|nr:hypothetical protein PRZ48_007826 [Zasmidium cellare]
MSQPPQMPHRSRLKRVKSLGEKFTLPSALKPRNSTTSLGHRQHAYAPYPAEPPRRPRAPILEPESSPAPPPAPSVVEVPPPPRRPIRAPDPEGNNFDAEAQAEQLENQPMPPPRQELHKRVSFDDRQEYHEYEDEQQHQPTAYAQPIYQGQPHPQANYPMEAGQVSGYWQMDLAMLRQPPPARRESSLNPLHLTMATRRPIDRPLKSQVEEMPKALDK